MIFGESYIVDNDEKIQHRFIKNLIIHINISQYRILYGFRVLSNETCSKNLIGPLQKKKLKLWRLLQNRILFGKDGVPNYIGEKGRTLGKTYGIKARCYWEHPWGTHWEPREHIENLKGIKEKGKMKKKSFPPPPPFYKM